MQLSYNEIQRIKAIAEQFKICEGEITHILLVDSGRINATYKVTVTHDDDTVSYMLQRINSHVFKNIENVMDNALRVTGHIRSKGKKTLEYIYTRNNGPLLYDETGIYRMTKFIHAEVFQNITRPKDMQMLGVAVGDFAFELADFDAKSLHDTIPDFHNTQIRYENFILSALNNLLNAKNDRVEKSREELDFVNENRKIVGIIANALASGEIPTRVTHNDTKLNNVLFDRKSNLPRCMIDLDTVMSGSVLYDIADAIRFGANTVSEEEKDFAKAQIDLNLLREFLVGFASVAREMLTEREIQLLPIAIKIMPLELGIRFLTDYYDGDVYFGTWEDGQNLARARVQFALAKDIDKKMNEIEEIVREIFN